MRKIYSNLEVAYLEKQICQERAEQTEEQLLELKSNQVCYQFRRQFQGKQRVVVFAGTNYKGLLALSVATTLASFGHELVLVLLNPLSEPLPYTARERVELAMGAGVAVMEVRDQFKPPIIYPEDIVVDGICEEGTEPLPPMYVGVIRYLNGKKARKLSLLEPTGLPSEGVASEEQAIFRAEYTYTFYGPRLSFLMPENEPYVGHWHDLVLGVTAGQLPIQGHNSYLFGEADMEGAITPRGKFTHKYNYGKALLVGGSRGMYGAALLAGRASFATGVGHLTVHIPQGAEVVLQSALPEALVHLDTHTERVTEAPNLAGYSAIAVGPGLGKAEESALVLLQIISECKVPLVLDADALNILATQPEWYELLPAGTVLTPHVGECDRLLGTSGHHLERIAKARAFAQKHQVVLLIKGAYSVVVAPSGDLYFNTSGNAGLATAGTGDVLTGMVLSFLAKGVPTLQAVLMAVYLHGFAADLYRGEFSEESLTASELIRYLPRALKVFRPW